MSGDNGANGPPGYVPLPQASPEPPRIGEDEHPSGAHHIPNLRETIAIADQAVSEVSRANEKTARATKLQWIGLGLLGSVTLAVGAFLSWCLITLGVIGNAQAQTAAKADTALESSKQNAARIEVIDAGQRASYERLERKIDDNNANTDRKLTDMQVPLQAVLRAVKK